MFMPYLLNEKKNQLKWIVIVSHQKQNKKFFCHVAGRKLNSSCFIFMHAYVHAAYENLIVFPSYLFFFFLKKKSVVNEKYLQNTYCSTEKITFELKSFDFKLCYLKKKRRSCSLKNYKHKNKNSLRTQTE